MARVQTYENHRRMRPVYHYIMTPLGLVLTGWAVYMAAVDFSADRLFLALLSTALLLGLYLPRVFALENQDRIIRMEMRYRYHLLTGKRLEPLEEKLGWRRLIALRFASDAELPELIETALREQLKADEIKKRIKDWQPDWRRV